jgi:hypothetical protein
MPDYFIIRSTTDPNTKPWILSEVESGRLRQGWFAAKGTGLVTGKGAIISRSVWTKKFQQIVRGRVPKPTIRMSKSKAAESAKLRSIEFARDKYDDFTKMLDISEGTRIVLPKLDGQGREEGFVIARAARPRSRLGPRRGCYIFDTKTNTPHNDYRHVVVVDPDSVRVIPARLSKVSQRVHDALGRGRRHPVIHSKDDRFNRDIESLYTSSSPVSKAPVPPAPSGAEEKQARERIEAEIMRRRGQPKFRQDLLDTYGRRCAISSCDAEAALEAAHIRTYKRADVNHVRNGILLRADLHTLFDLGLIAVRTSTWTVTVAAELEGTAYESLDGKRVRLPANKAVWPKQALDHHHQKVFNP